MPHQKQSKAIQQANEKVLRAVTKTLIVATLLSFAESSESHAEYQYSDIYSPSAPNTLYKKEFRYLEGILF